MERGARLSGSRFGYILGDAARLALALYWFALDRAIAQGFIPVIPPILVREEAMYGTGFFPAEQFEIYKVADEDLYLTGTSEVALAGLHMGEILDADELPLRYAGFSTNFRREAGAAGRDTRGMFRVHQFNKVEMFAYVRPEESWDEHERMLDDRGVARARARASVPCGEHRGVASSAPRGRSATTWKPGSLRRSGTASSHRRRTRPTTRRAASGSATAARRGRSTSTR